MLMHKERGDDVSWLVMTQAHEPQWGKELIARKAQEVSDVAAAYGIVHLEKAGFPTVMLDTVPQSELMVKIECAVSVCKPELVYLVHDGDIHSDHGAVFGAAMAVFKPFRMNALGVRTVLCFETLSSTEAAPPQLYRTFVPNVFQDISPFVERKIEIMSMFASETQDEPFPRSPSAIRALARFRGSSIGVPFAESFMLMRQIGLLDK